MFLKKNLRKVSKNVELNTDFKPGEIYSCTKCLPDKSYNSTTFMIMSKNGKTSNSFIFLLIRFRKTFWEFFYISVEFRRP
jgi:hypothetical protein